MKNKFPIILICILGLAAITYLAMERISQREARLALEKENVAKTKEVQRLEGQVTRLEGVIQEEKEAITPSEKIAEVFGEETPPPVIAPEPLEPEVVASVRKGMQEEPPPIPQFPQLDCPALERRISSFFAYLDKQIYPFPNSSSAYLKDVMTKLSQRLPIPGEVFNPADVLANSYHLYRVLSKKDIFLIKEILRKEKNTMEQTMDYFYQYRIRCQGPENFLPSLDVFYEYAHFLLSSMGGRSYLFRLDGDLRILLLYYSALIIHEADLQEVNRNGLDIRPYLSKLENDIKNHKRLYYSERYLYEIRRIAHSYPPLPPAS